MTTTSDLALQALTDETIRFLRTDMDPRRPDVMRITLDAATRLTVEGDPERARKVLIAYHAAVRFGRVSA